MALEIKAYLNQSDLNKVDKQYSQFIKDLTSKYKITVKVDTNGLKQVQSQVQNSFNQMSNNFSQIQSKVQNSTKPMTKSVDDLGDSFKKAQPKANSFFSDIGTAMEKFPIWIAVSTVYMQAIHKIGEAFNFTVEQSKLFTNLQMEMTNTKLNFGEVTKTANDYALSMKSSTDSVMKAISVFGTYNSTMDETLEKSKAAVIMNNITGGSIEQTADELMGIMAQYDLAAEDSMHVVDIIAGTARNLQIDFPKGISTISEGIRTVGSVAKESKVPIELLSSMIGTLSEKTRRDGAEIANGLRTIFGRILNVGEDADPESFKKVEKELDGIGIKIREIGNPQSLRPVGDILQELAGKWNTLSDAQRQQIAFDSAGMYRKNIFMTMMESYNDILKNNEAAINSVGVAESKQDIYQQSLTASLNELKASWEKLYLGALSPEKVKPWIEIATNIVNMADSFGVANMAIVLLDAVLIKFIPNIELLATSILDVGIKGIPALIASLNPLTIAIVAVSAAIIGLNIVNQKYIESLEKQYEEDKKSIDILNEKNKAIEKNAGQTKTLLAGIQELKEKQKLSNDEHSRYVELMTDLQKLYPTVFNNLDIEKSKYEDIVTAINQAIQAKAKLYAADSHGELEKLRSEQDKLILERDKLQVLTDVSSQVGGNLITSYINSKKIKALNNEINKYDELISKGRQSMVKGLSEFKPYNPKEDLTPSVKSNSSSTSGNEKSLSAEKEISETIIKADRYADLNAEIERTNSLLAKNKALQENVSDKERVKLLNEEIELLKQKQKNLHDLAGEIGGVVNKNASKGVDYGKGNIDLNHRPVVINPDGSLSTVRSMSFSDDSGKEILIPTIRKGLNRAMTGKEAIDYYYATGEYLGKFDTPKEAEDYAKKLHEAQEKIYSLSSSTGLRKEREELVNNLKSQGATFSGEGDLIELVNTQALLQKKLDEVNAHRLDKNKTLYNQLKAQYDDLNNSVKRFIDLQTKEIPNASVEWWNLQKAIGQTEESINKVNETNLKNYESVQKELSDLVKKKYEAELNEAEKARDKKKDILDEELDDFKETINEQIDELDKLYDKQDFEKNQSKATSKISDLTNERNTLSMAANSGDLEAINRIKEIDKELAEERENLADLQQDREHKLRKENLQDSLDAKEKEIKDAKDAADREYEITKSKYDSLLTEQNLYNEASKLLTNNALADISKMFTDLGLVIDREFTQKLQEALQYLNQITGSKTNINIPNSTSNINLNQNTSSGLSSIIPNMSSILDGLKNINIASMIPTINPVVPVMTGSVAGGLGAMTIGDIIINTQTVDENNIGNITKQIFKNIKSEFNKSGGMK